MIKFGICDDDKKVIEEIKQCIKSYEGIKYEIFTYESGEELLNSFKKVDVIFLDIDMTGINGIETAKKIREFDKEVKIIYVTSYTDYLNLAFSVHAFGYLNKPVNKEEIHKQIKEVLSYSKEKKREKLEFLTLEGVVRLFPEDIYYFEYINRKVILETSDKKYILKAKITKMAEDMKEYGFIMPHKSFTVNLFHVKCIKGYNIFMTNGSIIPLSQKKSSEFRNEFNKFLEEHIFN